MSVHSTHGPWCHCLLLVTGTGGEGYLNPHSHHPAYPPPQEHHVNVCPPQYRTSNKHNSTCQKKNPRALGSYLEFSLLLTYPCIIRMRHNIYKCTGSPFHLARRNTWHLSLVPKNSGLRYNVYPVSSSDTHTTIIL